MGQISFHSCWIGTILFACLSEIGIAAEPIGKSEYEFKHQPGKPVVFFLGGMNWKGTLSGDGVFVPDLKTKPWLNTPLHLNWEYKLDAINTPSVRSEAVYEYHAGILVEGSLRGVTSWEDLMTATPPVGTFIAKVGGKVIDFKEYRYDPQSLRIYNLPGEFVKKQR